MSDDFPYMWINSPSSPGGKKLVGIAKEQHPPAGEPGSCPIHSAHCPSHPNLFDRITKGREVEEYGTPAQHYHTPAGDLIQGDGFFHEGKSWVVRDIRDHEVWDQPVRTITAEPRAGSVGRHVISRLQFGVPDITLEDTEQQKFMFHRDQVIPRRG